MQLEVESVRLTGRGQVGDKGDEERKKAKPEGCEE